MPVITPRIRLGRSARGSSGFARKGATPDRLSDLGGVRENPGNLRARCFVPEGLKGPAPLVVVLHGCTQDAAVYDHGSGWSTLAERHGFALLFPEQQRANNPMLCFNWFSSDDTRRGAGEAASIKAMIEAMAAQYSIDPEQIHVTGLSAGGAMAAAMLAAYPDVFAAGAIIAGVPYGCAQGVGDAFECMGGRANRNTDHLVSKVRQASPHKGRWPRLQVWHGSADSTVVPANANTIAAQWAQLHGLAPAPDRVERAGAAERRVWTAGDGQALIEQYSIGGMGHGVPLASGGKDDVGAPGAHMLDVGVSSTSRIAAFFGIAKEQQGGARASSPPKAGARPAAKAPQAVKPAHGPQAIIEKALRAAGLMR
jgi:poly(hydroxyalkanoate) depolymerase family esterase